VCAAYFCIVPPWTLHVHFLRVYGYPHSSPNMLFSNLRRHTIFSQTKRTRSGYFCNKQKKKQQDSQKCNNLTITNCSDFNEASKERIWQQVLQSVSVASNVTSISSSITGVTGGTSIASAGAGRGPGGKPVVFMYSVQMQQTKTNRPILSVAIQMKMPHITLQLGLVPNDSHSPSI
jgi:hypothetical protein